MSEETTVLLAIGVIEVTVLAAVLGLLAFLCH